MKKYKFSIPCSWEMCGYYHIEAESLEDAADLARNETNFPSDPSYIDGSFQINYDCLEEANRVLLEKIKVYETPKKKLPLLMGTLESESAKELLNKRMKEL